jgi:hypothetical protein
MATNLNNTTFLAEYNDDYRDSDHYHRILFNNGRALQARELTQLQTIIQKELERLAKFIVTEGAIFNAGTNIAAGTESQAFTYLIVDSLPVNYSELIGTEIDNGETFAEVKKIIPANTDVGDPNNVVIVRLTRGKTGGSIPSVNPSEIANFALGDILDTTLGSGVLTIKPDAGSIGSTAMVEVPTFNTYAGGHLLFVEAQSIVIGKYTATPTVKVGFKLSEQIVTASDNIALYDNSGATPNLTSPGADRLKITLTLTTADKIVAGETFYELYDIVNGVAELTNDSNKILAEVGGILNERTSSITGDFIEQKAGGSFGLTINKDSADDRFLSYEIEPGTAFVNGRRITRNSKSFIRVAKPRSLEFTGTYEDVLTKSNEVVNAKYGNYFLAAVNDTLGMVDLVDTLSTVNLYPNTTSAFVFADTHSYGTARVRNVDKVGDFYRIHVFDLNMDSDGLMNGTPASIKAVRSIGVDSGNFAILSDFQGDFDILDRDDNTMLFSLSNARVQDIQSFSTDVARIATGTPIGGAVSLNLTGLSDGTLQKYEDWIIAYDSGGQLYTTPTVTSGGVGNTSVTIDGLPENKPVHALLYTSETSQLKTKTITPTVASGNWHNDSNLSLTNGIVNLSKSDIFKFNKVYDDTDLTDITYKFITDNGQRDNYYGPGQLRLKAGATPPSGTFWVQYRYFEHSVPTPSYALGYFGPASYTGNPDFDWGDIPYYTKQNGTQIKLSDYIDLRPTKDASGNFTRIEPIPQNTDKMTVSYARYWLPRTDVLTMSPEGILSNYSGNSGVVPRPPENIPPNHMILSTISLNPYVLNKNDLGITPTDNRGFKMRDLRAMDRRLQATERFSTLALAELDLMNLSVVDENGAVREINGFVGDGFNSPVQSNINDVDYRADIRGSYLTPMVYRRKINLSYDEVNSSGVVRKGQTVWPTFTEEVYISQDKPTQYENVNQFDLGGFYGSGRLSPGEDRWTERRLVDKAYASVSNTALFEPGDNAGVVTQVMFDPPLVETSAGYEYPNYGSAAGETGAGKGP